MGAEAWGSSRHDGGIHWVAVLPDMVGAIRRKWRIALLRRMAVIAQNVLQSHCEIMWQDLFVNSCDR